MVKPERVSGVTVRPCINNLFDQGQIACGTTRNKGIGPVTGGVGLYIAVDRFGLEIDAI
jgi:hypothetical protein